MQKQQRLRHFRVHLVEIQRLYQLKDTRFRPKNVPE